MSKLFAYAGTCVVNGATVYKFANDANRAAVLTKLGATDVNMIALPFAMGKEAAVDYLTAQGMTAGWRRAAAVAKTAPKAKAPKVAKAATVAVPVTKSRRVGDKPRKGQSVEQFVDEWFADKEAKLAKKAA